MINVVKQGYAHHEISMNCQDATGVRYHIDNVLKIVCDGCSEGKYSEVGSNLFCKLYIEKYMQIQYAYKSIDIILIAKLVMDTMINLLGNDPRTIRDYMSFTTLIAHKIGDRTYEVAYCGDGYIISQRGDDIQFDKIDNGEYPKYLVYNYLDSGCMAKYHDGVEMDYTIIEDVDNVGVASDGARFIIDREENDPLYNEFCDILMSDKSLKLKLFFNRNEKLFQDDFSIVL